MKASINTDFEIVYQRLKQILEKNKGKYSGKESSAGNYGICGKPGPTVIKIWGGKTKRTVMPVASVQIGKAYVSYHLMGIYTNAILQKEVSKELKTRMQGKSCFNFKKIDEKLFKELDQLTARSIADMEKMGLLILGA
jgi:hypothetical protein